MAVGSLVAQAASEPAIIPRPSEMTTGRGVFRLTARTTIVADRGDSMVARRLARDLTPATGFTLPVEFGSTAASGNRIVFRRAAARDTTLGAEGYRLDVKPGVVTITSATPAGAFYATQTIRQLLPPAIFREATVSGASLDDSRRRDRRSAALFLARHAPRRLAALHAEGVREEVHRPPRAPQNEYLPLASHR